MRPWNRKITTNWEIWLSEKLFRDHYHSGEGAIAPTAPRPYESATSRNRGHCAKGHRMRLSFLCEQLVSSSEQLVLVDTKKGF